MYDPTTKRHPRTTLQAFGVDATSAYPITHYKRRIADVVADVVLAGLIGGALAAMLVHWWVS